MTSSIQQAKFLMQKHLSCIPSLYLLSLSQKLYPGTQSISDPYILLFFKIKTYISLIKPKGLSLKEIINEIINKAYSIDQNLGNNVKLLFQECDFVKKFQGNGNGVKISAANNNNVNTINTIVNSNNNDNSDNSIKNNITTNNNNNNNISSVIKPIQTKIQALNKTQLQKQQLSQLNNKNSKDNITSSIPHNYNSNFNLNTNTNANAIPNNNKNGSIQKQIQLQIQLLSKKSQQQQDRTQYKQNSQEQNKFINFVQEINLKNNEKQQQSLNTKINNINNNNYIDNNNNNINLIQDTKQNIEKKLLNINTNNQIKENIKPIPIQNVIDLTQEDLQIQTYINNNKNNQTNNKQKQQQKNISQNKNTNNKGIQIYAQHIKKNNQNIINNSSNNNNNININDLKRINQRQKILNKISDPFSSARRSDQPLLNSPITKQHNKQSFTISSKNQPKPSSTSKPSFFSNPRSNPNSSNPSRYQTITFSSYSNMRQSLRNLSLNNSNSCLCQTLCQNIVLSEDSFLCVHCENIYHTRCMKKTSDAKNCMKCHLKYLLPNKQVVKQIYLCVLKKNQKKHQINFILNNQILQLLQNKKNINDKSLLSYNSISSTTSNYKLQIRSFRLKQTTSSFILFPDSCNICINNKQIKQFKPLHKQSSLKYRKDQPLTILKHNYQFNHNNNKLTITQYNNNASSSQDRIQSEDHLLGIYLIQEKTLNDTIDKIIRNSVTTFKQSKNLLKKNFNLGKDKFKSLQLKNNNRKNNMIQQQSQNNNSQQQQSDQIKCQVIKIPLTCALTTQKLKYPARGLFCQHFQCFDLRNFIMITSSSSNPKWICPLCKLPCYQFKVDCILAQILQNYSQCHKAEQIMLYRNGKYQILDKNGIIVNEKGKLIKNDQNDDFMNVIQGYKEMNVDDLAIVDKNKRQREKQIQKQKDKQHDIIKKNQFNNQQEENKLFTILNSNSKIQIEQDKSIKQEDKEPEKRKKVFLPPQDQIILLSDDDQL